MKGKTVPASTEVYAVRRSQSETGTFPVWDSRADYNGRISIEEQITQAGTKYLIQPPKMGIGRERVAHLPYFLPNWEYIANRTHVSQREAIGSIVARFKQQPESQNNVSFWTCTDKEAGLLWTKGYVPIGWMLLERFRELWNSPALADIPPNKRVDQFREMLLFPARSNPRMTKDGLPAIRPILNPILITYPPTPVNTHSTVKIQYTIEKGGLIMDYAISQHPAAYKQVCPFRRLRQSSDTKTLRSPLTVMRIWSRKPYLQLDLNTEKQ